MNIVLEKISNIVNDIREDDDLPSIKVEDNMKLREDLGLDSLGLARLTVALEDEFDVDVFEDGVVYTVKELLHKISKKVK